MKNIVLSAVTVIAMSSFAVAGGDIAPIEEPIVEVPEVVEVVVDAGFYLGLGYGSMKGEETYHYDNALGNRVSIEIDTRDFDQLLLQAGYKFNSYVAIEGRYWIGMNDLSDTSYYFDNPFNTDATLNAFGIYVKPMYPVTEEFDVYALLGYGKTSLEEDIFIPGGTFTETTDLDGFSWGLGVSYTFNGNVSIFADYVVLYDDNYDEYQDYLDTGASSDFVIDTFNVGVSYKF
ncbi:MAG: porin family protein [Campylobacterota bacterium]|nr:porin family protein [Campylobacterota bacterium]